MANGVRQI